MHRSPITHSIEASDRDEVRYWTLAWIVFCAAMILRLYFFGGFVLGDDPNFHNTPMNVLRSGRFNLHDHHTSRLAMLIPQVIAYRLLPINDFSFVLPIFTFAIGCHIVSMFFLRDLLGNRAALLVSIMFAVTPYESLAATSFAPDYIVAFFGITSAWMIYRGLITSRRTTMVWAGACFGASLFAKISAILFFAPVGLVALVTRSKLRGWIFYGIGAAIVVIIGSAFFYLNGGEPLHWFYYRAVPPEGHDLTANLRHTLMVYPKYLLWKDPDHGPWMFGITGWLWVAGTVISIYHAFFAKGRVRSAAILVLLGTLVVLLVNFVPHKMTLTAYYSHPRIYRYMAQFSTFVHIGAAFALEMAFRSKKVIQWAATGLLCAAIAFGLYQMPSVTEPSWGPGSDGRALARYFWSIDVPKGTKVHTDWWHCIRLELIGNEPLGIKTRCLKGYEKEKKERFLNEVTEGYVVTGGGRLGWYSSLMDVLNLSELDFEPPSNWTLVYERSGPIHSWRREPLRIWKVETHDSPATGSVAEGTEPGQAAQ